MIKRKLEAIYIFFMAILMVSCNSIDTSRGPVLPDIDGETHGFAVQTTHSPEPSVQPVGGSDALSSGMYAPTPEPVPTPPPFEMPGPGRAVIIFTFDDGPVSDYLLAYPILKEYGIKGTSYIITKYIDEGLEIKLSWDQVKEMSEYGWVFGGHTYDHHHLTDLTDMEIQNDCAAVSSAFCSQGLAAPDVMAYPYGAFSDRVIEEIRQVYRQARLADYRTDFVDPIHTDPYRIPSVSADMQSENELKSVEQLVDQACVEGAVIVFRVHTLYKEHPYDTVARNTHILSGCAPQTDSGLFKELVKYCVDKSSTFMTMTDLMNYMDGLQAHTLASGTGDAG